MPLHFQWHYQGQEIGERKSIELHDGDMFIMNEKATGNDYKTNKSEPVLKHAAGLSKLF
jgi:hypothetical protein